MYYTYVLKCCDGKFYVGSSSDMKRRLMEHKCGNVISTKNRRPVELVYYEACRSKEKALEREKYFKTGFGRGFLTRRI